MKRSLFVAAIAALSLGVFSACNQAPAATKEESKGTDAKPAAKFETAYLEEVKGLSPSTYSFGEKTDLTDDANDIYVKVADGKIYHWEFSRTLKDKVYKSVGKHEVPIKSLADADISAIESLGSPTGFRENTYSVTLNTKEEVPFMIDSEKGKKTGKTNIINITFTDKAQAESFVAQVNALRKG